MNRYFYLILIPLLFVAACGTEGNSIQSDEQKIQELDSLISVGVDLFDEGKYIACERLYDSLETIIEATSDSTLQLRHLINRTELIKRKGDYQKALDNYFDAVGLASAQQNSSQLALCYYNIATIQYNLKNYEECLNYCEKAEKIYKRLDDKSRIANVYTVKAIAYRKLEKDGVMDFLLKAKAYYVEAQDEKRLGMCLTNIANGYFEAGQLDKALAIYFEALEIQRRNNSTMSLSVGYGNIAECYLEKEMYREATQYLDSSQSLAHKLDYKITKENNYQRWVDFFEKQGDFKSALIWQDSLLQVRTEMMRVETEDYIASLDKNHAYELEKIHARGRIKIMEKDAERRRLLVYFLIAIGLTVGLLGFWIINRQRRLRRSESLLHQERMQSMEAQNEVQKLKIEDQQRRAEQLKDELEFKRQELLQFSITISERVRDLQIMQQKIEKLSPSNDEQRNLVREIRSKLNTAQELDQTVLLEKIERVNKSFYYTIHRKFDQLTTDDIRLASLILLDLSSKEISDVLHIEPKSVEMKRYRLRKKLDLDTSVDLKEFLRNL